MPETNLNLIKICPFNDFKGARVCEGDRVIHPSGETGIIEFQVGFEDPADQWRVVYSDGTWGRACLQVGERGQAVVTPVAETRDLRGAMVIDGHPVLVPFADVPLYRETFAGRITDQYLG